MKRQRGDYPEHWSHIKYEYLIHAMKDFIVFIDDQMDLDWETSREYDEAHPELDPKLNSILNEAALLESSPCEGFSHEVQLRFKRLVGEAIARGLDGDFACGMNMLKDAETFFQARSQETSRQWYLTASLLATVPFLLSGGAFWWWRDPLTLILGSGLFWLALSACAGALGALLSVILRTGKLNLNYSAGKRLHYLEAASRIWAGAISGAIVALGVRTEVVLAPLARGDKRAEVMILAALAAGAGERLATSIISKVNVDSSKGPSSKK